MKHKPRIVAEKKKQPYTRQFYKIGEKRRIRHPFLERRGKQDSTGESGFPLVKDALVEEIIRDERKKRYADELRAQVSGFLSFFEISVFRSLSFAVF